MYSDHWLTKAKPTNMSHHRNIQFLESVVTTTNLGWAKRCMTTWSLGTMFCFRNLWWLATRAKPKTVPQRKTWECSISGSVCGDCQHDAWKCSVSGICGDCQCEAWQCSILGVCSDCQPGPSKKQQQAPEHEVWNCSVSGICGDCQPGPSQEAPGAEDGPRSLHAPGVHRWRCLPWWRGRCTLQHHHPLPLRQGAAGIPSLLSSKTPVTWCILGAFRGL